MDTATETPTVAVPQDEASALKTLKSKLDDKTLLIDQGDALQSHMIAFPQSPAQLAKKIDKSRSWVTEVAGFAKLPENLKAQARETKAGYRDLRALQSVVTGGNNEVISVNRQNPGSVGKINSVVPVNKQVNSVNSKSPTNTQGYPLIRDTVDELVKLLTFWRQQLNLGLVVERWLIYFGQIGWLKTGVSVMAIGLAGYGGWQAALNLERGIWNAEGGNNFMNNLLPSSALRTRSSASGAPHLIESRLVAGNHMLLRWDPVGAGDTYRVYWHGQDGTMEAVDQDVTATGVTVNRQSVTGHEKGFLTVTAISPNQTESTSSQGVEYDLTPVNEDHLSWVKPLPQTGTEVPQLAAHSASPGLRPPSPSGRGAGGEALQLPRSLITPPVEVHAIVRTPDLIRLTWRAVGPNVHYNVYSSASSVLSTLRKENDHPLKSNTVDWTPETGLERYWIVVTALDAQNHESAYSEAIEVVRHPEKSGSNAAMDAATGEVRKLLPW